MAHFWLLLTPASGGSAPVEWAVAELEGEAFDFTPDKQCPLRRVDPLNSAVAVEAQSSASWIVRVATPAGEAWALLSRADMPAWINGGRLQTGLRILRDRDEIHVRDSGRFFFSTERLVQIEPFPGHGRDACCPRCKQPLEHAVPSVKCPTCGVFHHQSPELGCWTYSEACAMGCGQPTALSSGYRWTPEGL